MMAWWRRLGERADPHLTDGRLLEILVPSSGADPSDVKHKTERHLHECPPCVKRLEELRTFLDNMTAENEVDFDAAFSPQHLTRQRASILHRLERATGSPRPGRILRFPASARPVLAHVHTARWWLGATAAAGLLAGVGIGQFAHLHPAQMPSVELRPTQVASAGMEQERADPRGAPDDSARLEADAEAFMNQVESVLVDHEIRELRALDAITPRASEVALSRW